MNPIEGKENAQKKMLQEQYEAAFNRLHELKGKLAQETDPRKIATLKSLVTTEQGKLERLRKQGAGQ